MNSIEEKCKVKGVRLTDQRKVIARVMSETKDHPDVDELHKRIIEVDKNFLKFHKDRTLIFGTMGYATSSFIPSLSLFVMSLNSNNNLSTEKQIALNDKMT